MRVSEQTRDQVMTVIQRLVEALGRKDVGGILALTDVDFRGFWSDAGDKVVGKEALQRYLEQDSAPPDLIGLEISSIHISAEGTVAWVMADVRFNMVGGGAREGLLTAVLRGTGHTWLFAQVHCS